MLLRLALRNLLRSPRRTGLTVVAVIAGVALSIVGRGFIAGLTEGIIIAATDGTVGHVMARPAGYPTVGFQRPVDALLELNAPAQHLLEEEARAWTGRLLFAPLAAHGSDALRLAAIGFDPERDPTVFPRDRWTVSGTMPSGENDGVAVSMRVAELLGLKLGDRLVLQVRTHQGALNALEVEIAALVRTDNPALDTLGLWAPAPLARSLLRAEAPTHLSVKLADRDDAPAFAARLAAALGAKADVVTWQEETADLIAIQKIRVTALNLVVFILLALAAFGIANTILMAAYERIREVGTLRAMGMTEAAVLRLFLLEGALMGVVGALVGAGIGGGLVSYWHRHPIDFSQTMERAARGMSMSSLIYTQLEPMTLAVAVALGTAVAALASLYPARVAARMVPADAVRGG